MSNLPPNFDEERGIEGPVCKACNRECNLQQVTTLKNRGMERKVELRSICCDSPIYDAGEEVPPYIPEEPND